MPSPAATPSAEHTAPVAEDPMRLALAWRTDPRTPLAEFAEQPVTIGSGPRCSLRLTDAGLRPLQCVVTPTEAGPRVRRWASGSLLNGETFEEAPLACGDRLSLGTVELVVVDLAGEAEAEAEGVVVEDVADSLDQSEAEPPAAIAPGSIDLATLAGNEWAIPADYDSAALPVEYGIAESVQAWTEALPAPPDSETLVAAPKHEADLAGIEQLREQLAMALTAAELSTHKAEQLQQRQSGNRRRVKRLIEALRRQTGEADLLRLAVEEREQSMSDLQTRLEATQGLGETVRAEIAEMQVAHALELQSQAERLEADHAARLAEAVALHATPPAEPQALPEPAEEGEESLPATTEALAPAPEEALWTEASDPAVDETVTQAIAEAEALLGEIDQHASSAEYASPEPEAAPDWHGAGSHQTSVEEESPWGIEQLADGSESGSVEETFAEPSQPETTAFENEEQAVGPDPEPVVDWFAHDGVTEPELEQADEPSQAESPAEPHSFIEKYGHLLPGEDEEFDAIPAVEPEPAPVVAEDSGDEDSGDELIEDYMQRLMQRVRGESPTEQDAMRSLEEKPEAREETVVATEARVEKTPQPIQDLSELSRSAAPEATADMDALRQLANHSARSAIHVASTKESREHAALHLVGSVIGITFGTLASMTALSPYGPQFIGGLVTVVGCGWYGVKKLGIFQMITAAEELGEHNAERSRRAD